MLFKGGDPAATIRVLQRHDADIVLLQEVTPDWVARLRAAGLGADATYAPHRGTHGLAVVAKRRIRRTEVWRNARGLLIGQCAEVDGSASVCHVHLASPSGALTQSRHPLEALRALEANAQQRRQQWQHVEAEMKARFAPAVITGDFNSLSAESWMVDARRRWVDAARTRAWGWAGATFPRLAASAHQPPWPIDRFGQTGPWIRIDYVLVDPALRIRTAGVLPGGGSDHAAVHAVVQLP